MSHTEHIHADPRAPVGPLRLREAGGELLAVAAVAADGRASRTLTLPAAYPLRQTLFALLEGRQQRDPHCQGSVTLQVLAGKVRCTTPHGAWDVATGGWSALPAGPWGIEARTDAVVMVTTASQRALVSAEPPYDSVGARGA